MFSFLTEPWSTEAWTMALVFITFMVYLYIGWSSRVRETKGFYVAGGGVPAIANGAATAADWMSAASFISMAGMISFMGFSGSAYLMGWTGGYVLLALLLAPYLRKFGKYTVPDFVGERYDSDAARVVAAICAIFVSLTYVAGQMRGVGVVFSRFLGVDISVGVILGMIVVGFFSVLGGMKGITWTQVVQYGVLIVAYLIPAAAISAMLTGNPVPQLALTSSDVMQRLNDIQFDLGFSSFTTPFASMSQINMLCLTLTLMVGTAGLPHIIVRFYTVKNVTAARQSAGWALLFIAILYTTAPALAVFARYNLLSSLHGARIERVDIANQENARAIYHLTKNGKPVTWTTKWQQTGLISFSDPNNNGILELHNQNGKLAEAVIDRDIIVLATPEVAQLAPWVIALVATGGLAAALSTAAGLLLVISSSIAHDLYVHFVNPNASEAKRLAVGRIMIGISLIAAGLFGIKPPAFVAQVVAFAFGLAAASFFPIILLGIFDKRTNRHGAIAGMIVGLGFTTIYIMGNLSDKVLGTPEPFMTPWCFGITAEGIGIVGCLLNFIVTFVVSRLTPPPPAKVQELVESLRIPRGVHAPVAHFDETDTEADNP
jgi:cation/acetate symporter